jgi:mRNA turnover protein 4
MVLIPKKTKEDRSKEESRLKEFIVKYETILSVESRCKRSEFLHSLRNALRGDSAVVLGKKTILLRSLSSVGTEDMKRFMDKVNGDCFLIFTNRGVDEIQSILESSCFSGYLRAGDIVPRDVVLESGVIKAHDSPLSLSLEKKLREHGLPISVKDGTLVLNEDHLLGKEGESLSCNKARLLKLLGLELAVYTFKVVGVYCGG